MSEPRKLKDLKKGEYFTRKPVEYPTERQVLIRGEYDRGTRLYSCQRFSDINDYVDLRGDALVYTDFTF